MRRGFLGPELQMGWGSDGIVKQSFAIGYAEAHMLRSRRLSNLVDRKGTHKARKNIYEVVTL
jgi:hypothetical protein